MLAMPRRAVADTAAIVGWPSKYRGPRPTALCPALAPATRPPLRARSPGRRQPRNDRCNARIVRPTARLTEIDHADQLGGYSPEALVALPELQHAWRPAEEHGLGACRAKARQSPSCLVITGRHAPPRPQKCHFSGSPPHAGSPCSRKKSAAKRAVMDGHGRDKT
jgi:hypothetical protein